MPIGIYFHAMFLMHQEYSNSIDESFPLLGRIPQPWTRPVAYANKWISTGHAGNLPDASRLIVYS